jgi:ketosteroid isomerase-like protein
VSQENVETFLASVDAMNRADAEAMLALVAEDVVLSALRSAITGDYVGADGLRRFLADNAQTFDVFHAAYHDVRDLGDRVLAIGTIRSERGWASWRPTSLRRA